MKTALITGGSGGIGQATAKALSAEGYHVGLNYHSNYQSAKLLESDLIMPVRADVTNREQVANMVRAVEERFGPIDLLVNNAGIAQQKLFSDISLPEWQTMLDVHVTGAFNCCQEVLTSMVKRKSGNIINVSSMWGQTGGSCEVHYSTAKAALIGMTKSLAKELGLSGIRVNCVAPGVIQTPMNNGLETATIESLAEETPLARLGLPEDVANLICFLASEKSDFITGQVAAVNGGIII